MLNPKQSPVSCSPTMTTPFKIDRGNVFTPPPLPIPPSDQPTNVQVYGPVQEQEKKVTFLSTAPVFSPRVTRSVNKKASKAAHGLDRNNTAPPSGDAHPADKALNKSESPLADKIVAPEQDASTKNTKPSRSGLEAGTSE